MSTFRNIVASLSLAAIAGMAQPTWADSTSASCEFFKNGKVKQKRSGPCSFSQRQGYVDIKLRNGDTYSLSPGKQANHFKDQKGNKVVRKSMDGNSQKYKWDHKNIVVTFNRDNSGQSHDRGNHSSGESGKTPDKLRDLVGQRSGHAEDQLRERGYKLKNSSKSDGAIYSNWKERSTGRCVTIRTVDGRYKSIIYSTDYDCKH